MIYKAGFGALQLEPPLKRARDEFRGERDLFSQLSKIGMMPTMGTSDNRNILSDISGKQILIVGDVMLDEYIFGDVRRISPEAPVPIVEVTQRTDSPGGAANVARNVASLGGRPVLFGVTGSDPQADRLRKTVEALGIGANGLIRDSERPTTTKIRVLAQAQQLARLDSELTIPLNTATETELLRIIEKQMAAVDLCILSDYGKGVVSAGLAQHVIKSAAKAAKPVVVDPKGNDFAKYRGAFLITPNTNEAGRAVGLEIRNDSDLGKAGRALQEVLKGSALLVTQGPQGMTLFTNDGKSIHFPSEARTVFDVTGAGDTVVAVVGLCLAAHGTLDQAARIANAAAGIVVGKIGTSSVSQKDLSLALAQGC